MIFFICYYDIAITTASNTFDAPKFARLGSMTAKWRYITIVVSSKYLHPIIARIGDENKALGVTSQSTRVLKLTGLTALASKAGYVHATGVKYLNTMIRTVWN